MFQKLMRPKVIAVVVLVALAAWSVAEAQFGRGGFGGGGYVPPPSADDGILIERSLSGESLYGYSDKIGSWDKLTVEPHPEDGLSAVQTIGLAALRGKDHVYAFGAKSGKWASSKTDGEPSPLVVSARVAACVAGNHVYAFGPNSENWAIANIGESADPMKLEADVSRVVYRTESHVHVFSNASGKWASVDLTKD